MWNSELPKWEDIVLDKVEVVKKDTTVYNFIIEGYHTYYVSDLQIFTHNTCGNEPEKPSKLTINKKGQNHVKEIHIKNDTYPHK